MGRRPPLYVAINTINPSPLTHSIFYPTILVAWLVATIAIFSTLCVSRFRKKTKAEPESESNPEPTTLTSSPTTKLDQNEFETTTSAFKPDDTVEQLSTAPLKRPPWEIAQEAVMDTNATHGPIGPTVPVTASHKRKLSSTLSLKLPDKLTTNLSMKINDKLSRIKTSARKDKSVEDSIWMKTIILGEKNKVPNEEEDDGGVVIDEHGHRQKSYRPRSSTSVPISRNNSFVSVANSFSIHDT